MNGVRICLGCQVELAVKKNGVLLVSMGVNGASEAAFCDVLECPGCGMQFVGGVADAIAFGAAAVSHVIETSGAPVVRYWLNNRERNEFAAKAGCDHHSLTNEVVT